MDELIDFVYPLIQDKVNFFLVLDPQHYYIGCALALSFVVAFPLSVHQSQYQIILAVALSQVVACLTSVHQSLSLSCLSA